MTENKMLTVLKENSERIKTAAADAVLAKVVEDLRYHMPSALRDAINTFMEKEIAPEVTKALQSQKGAILSSVNEAADQIGKAVAEQLVANASKQLTGYKGGELLKRLVDD